MIANVCFLSFNNALHHQVFMTFLAGQPIFSSSHEKTWDGCLPLFSCFVTHHDNFKFWILNFEFMEFFSNIQLSTLNSQFVQYLFWISLKHFTNMSSFAQNICAITGDWSVSVNRCLITHGGLIIYPSAFMNSVRNHKVYFSFSPYISKISFVIWRKAQSVNQSMGAKPSIMRIWNVKFHINVRKASKITSKKIITWYWHII
jgi:hypothetical protein